MDKIIDSIIKNKNLIKMVFSKSKDENILKTTCHLTTIKNQSFIAFESFFKDGKTRQTNVECSNSLDYIKNLFPSKFSQLNILTSCGNAEIKQSKKGKILISNKIDLSKTAKAPIISEHNKQKNYILNCNNKIDFLVELGIQDLSLKIHDKKQSKFRQINRFLEIVRDVEKDILDGDSELYILDLCCGKSYLSFAVYYYFAVLKGYKVVMDCVDLKEDVILYCQSVAKKLNYKGLNFICDNVLNFEVKKTPNLTLSLHACDIATDIVLEKGIYSNSKVILSTPCCHHEVFWQLKKQNSHLDMLLENSILKGKLADVLTDSIRCKILEIMGWKTSAIELISPDETPKNVLIKGVKTKSVNENAKLKNIEDVKSLCKLFDISPYLYNKFIK